MTKDVFNEIHCGVTFGFYGGNGYFSSEQAKRHVDEIAATNANWVVLVVTVMQESFCSTRQFRDFQNTPNDLEIKEIIDYIHGKGIKVQLRPMLECFDGKGRLGVMFPADSSKRIPGLVCDYCSRWFDSMTKRSVYYARIAEMTGCEMFCLDSELDQIIRFGAQWKEVIRRVREVYSGPVTSCHTIHTGVIDFEKELADREHWFYDLDALSISDYIKCGTRGGLTAKEMAENMTVERDRLRRIAALYGKPIILGETGCSSVFGAAESPSTFYQDRPYDEDEQANYLEALVNTFADEPWWKGLYWWKWDENVARAWIVDPEAPDRGFTVTGKKAQQVMKDCFARLQAKV